MSKWVAALIVILIGLSWAGYRWLCLNDQEIQEKRWKFCDDLAFRSFGDFIGFDQDSFELRRDTVFLHDTAVATVVVGYRWFDGRNKLRLRGIANGRTVEYVSI